MPLGLAKPPLTPPNPAGKGGSKGFYLSLGFGAFFKMAPNPPVSGGAFFKIAW
jgi:hypothetical protein